MSQLKVAFTKSVYPNKNYSSLGVESTPIEMGGILYVETTDGIDALDATTGATKWQYHGAPNKKGLIGEMLAALDPLHR